jgi:hypothetical protein
MLKVIKHGDRSPVQGVYCPPAPKPQPRPLQPIALIRTLKRNPLECWAAQHFERPIVAGGLPIGHVLLAAAVRPQVVFFIAGANVIVNTEPASAGVSPRSP